MTKKADFTELRTKIKDRVSAVWERLWEGEGGLDRKHVARRVRLTAARCGAHRMLTLSDSSIC